MPEGLPGDQPQICACPGCDEVVVQSESGNTRLYHSAECRRKARRLRHEGRSADTADVPPAAANAEVTPAEPTAPAELAATELPVTAERPGTEAENDVPSIPEDNEDADEAENPADSVFWNPGQEEADGFWDADDDSPHKASRSPGRHRSATSHRSAASRRTATSHRTRLKRSHTVAIAVTLAASAVGLGLIFSQPAPRHPLASDLQLHPPGVGATQPASSSSSSPARHSRTRHPARHAAGGTNHAPPPATSPSPPRRTHSRAPSPTPSRTSSPPSPKPSRSPKPKKTRVPAGLISFENGADGWQRMYGSIRSAQSTWVAYSGSHSLKVTLLGDDAAVGVSNSSVSHLEPGDTVTYHVYSDGQSGGRVGVWAETWNQPEDVVETVPLPTQRGWFTITWTVPSVPKVDVIGIQVAHNGGGKLTLAIDALSWNGS